MRKFIYTLFVFVFLSSVAFGQVSISELMKVAKMDEVSFETYATNKGFEYYEGNEYEMMIYLCMNKADKVGEEFLYHYTKFLEFKYYSKYEINNTKILPNIYNELKSIGFKTDDSEEFKTLFERGTGERVEIGMSGSFLEIVYSMD